MWVWRIVADRSSTFVGDHVRVQVHVHAHHGVHGAEEVAAHAGNGREQIVEALERVVEYGMDAPDVAGAQETREEEARGAEVSLISHLGEDETMKGSEDLV